MSNLVYPTLPGLTFDVVRSPTWSTGVQRALSGKRSTIAYMLYPLISFELIYELLRDVGAAAYSSSSSEIKSLVGLFMQVQGQWDTFLFSDPNFNTVSAMPFGTGNGTQSAFQLLTWYQNSGGPGYGELVQNLNGAPQIFVNGTLQTLGTSYSLGATGIVTFAGGHIPAAAAALTWSGSFFYRCAFDDDKLEVSEFMSKLWEAKSVKFTTVKL